ncbi:hypothetical protein D6833_13470 [Candidatus Parcubacteria bacterium]|nr:MAG: hypothetical protein D6833_13470 [Candidatus Parcubacteria bacterium]
MRAVLCYSLGMVSTYAVLTGDIISSRTLKQEEKAQIVKQIQQTHSNLPDFFQLRETSGLSMFRGDGWQFALLPAHQALRVAVYVRCTLKGMNITHADSRIGIGIGPISTLTVGESGTGDGPAFQLSGKALDELKRSKGFKIQLDSSNEIGKTALAAIATAVNHLILRLTISQAKAVCGALRGWNHQQIADSWEPRPVTRQSITKHLKSAGWDVLEQQIQSFEHIISTLTGESL